MVLAQPTEALLVIMRVYYKYWRRKKTHFRIKATEFSGFRLASERRLLKGTSSIKVYFCLFLRIPYMLIDLVDLIV